jgi:putative transposase
MRNFLLEQQQKAEKIAILNSFIQGNTDIREFKRALAVKMALEGKSYTEITNVIGLHKSSITTWKNKFEQRGIDGIKLGYQGSIGYLTAIQKAEIIAWLRAREYCIIDELVTYLDENYGIIYKSQQSYYNLMSEANISWKKSQKYNPSADARLHYSLYILASCRRILD